MTRIIANDFLPADTFAAGSWWVRAPKEAEVVEHPRHGMEILPPLPYPPPARVPVAAPPAQPVRDEIPEGTFHAVAEPGGRRLRAAVVVCHGWAATARMGSCAQRPPAAQPIRPIPCRSTQLSDNVAIDVTADAGR